MTAAAADVPPPKAEARERTGDVLRDAAAVSESQQVRSVLESMRLVEMKGGVIRVGVDSRVRLFAEQKREEIEAAIGEAAGTPLRIEFETEQARAVEPPREKADVAEHPLVKHAVSLFSVPIDKEPEDGR